MDFMKVFDQTFKDIKREVNLKVLKVPEIEQKVLDATDDEPWGPHGSDLSEISRATMRYTDRQLVMDVLWTRLRESGPKWRHVYKALTVIEFLIANGSEKAVDDILDHRSSISVLSKFEYVEASGKDVGINVRKKAETIMGILTDKEKIKAAREKAAANRNKYTGLSSTGVTYKSSSSAGNSGYGSVDNYGSFTSSKGGGSFSEVCQEDSDSKGRNLNLSKKEKNVTNDNVRRKPPNVSIRQASEFKPHNECDDQEDDFDNFDPRRTSKSVTLPDINNEAQNKVDLVSPNLMDDFLDAAPTSAGSADNAGAQEVDLFADADFQSADSSGKSDVDLFSYHPHAGAFPSKPETGMKMPSEPIYRPKNASSETFDPFATFPLNSFEGSDPFDPFSSHNEPAAQSYTAPRESGAFFSHSEAANPGVQQPSNATTADSTENSKKQTFQVKSDIWADSLSRGLIDLNITAAPKVNLTDIGIVGGLGDCHGEKAHSSFGLGMTGTTWYTAASGTGSSSFPQQSPENFKWP